MTETQASTGNGKQHDGHIDTSEVIEKTRSALRERLDEQPYIVLGVAAAVGYVLAAGMPRPVVSYLLRYGLRTGLRASLRSFLGPMMPGGREEQGEEM